MTSRATGAEKPIGVFDSGIGGLTVVRALTRRLPHENIVYFGDTARVPYGPSRRRWSASTRGRTWTSSSGGT